MEVKQDGEMYAMMQTELASVLSKVNQWSLTKEKELQAMKSAHTTFLDTHKEMTYELKQRERQCKARMDRNSDEIKKQEQELSRIQSSNTELMEVVERIPQELSELQQQLAAEKENLNERQREVQNYNQQLEQKQVKLENGHELYEKCLGFRFERQVMGALVVTMHNIDPKNPSRKFSFNISVLDDSGKYTVTDCEPTVSGLPEMVKALNDTNSLTNFVRKVRKAWRSLCV